MVLKENHPINFPSEGITIWLCGLSGAGKTTIAAGLKAKLINEGYLAIVLDGDDLRAGINKGLFFSKEDRNENIRRTAEIAKLLSANSIISICSLITPLHADRKTASSILGKNYFEIFIDCPIEVCETRDVKGLYKKARAHKILHFTGIDSKFEIPSNPFLILHTNQESPQESIEKLFLKIRPVLTNSD